MSDDKARACWPVISAIALLGCGRTQVFFPPPAPPTPPAPSCTVSLAPARVSFGSVATGDSASETVTVTDTGEAACNVFGFTIVDGGSPGFAVAAGQVRSVTIQPGDATDIGVTFAPSVDALTAPVTGATAAQLDFGSNSPTQPELRVPLTATVLPGCELSASPAAVDFGVVPLETSVSQDVVVTSVGGLSCTLTSASLATGSDPEFAESNAPLPETLAPGQSFTAQVSFAAENPDAGATGTLLFATSVGPAGMPSGVPLVSVPLKATTPLGCAIVALPNPLTFGNVGLNQSISEQVTVENQGTLPCTVSNVALDPSTDPLFTLTPVAGPTTLNAGQTLDIFVTFDAAVSTPPFLHNGTLIFDTTDVSNATVDIPLSAFVSTACSVASQWIYTVDTANVLSQFDPSTLTFTDIGTLNCGDFNSPFSMAVDQNAVAWVEYQDGNLFEVQTSDASCAATTFQPDQHDINLFGMGFVFDPSAGTDTLYVAGGPEYMTGVSSSTLATIAFPSLILSVVAPITFGFPELAGTGDGQLWGFAASGEVAGGIPTLAQIDPTTGDVVQSFTYPTLGDGNFAMKFWGGSFWIFLGNSVYQVPRDTGVLTTVIEDSGRAVVGAGVSTCAPVQ